MMSPAERTNILVVDDLPEKLLVMESMLEELDQNIVTARTGAEALRHVLDKDFAVILLDVNMPDMDGFETAGFIRNRKKSAHTPIIFITAYADEMHTAQGYSLGAVDYICAPIMPAILRSKVRVFVELFQMNQQARRHAEQRVALVREQMARAAAEEATRRSVFLAESSKTLANLLEPMETLRALARLPVPFLADLAGVTLAGKSGELGRTELAWLCPPDPTVRSRTLDPEHAPSDELREAVGQVLQTGQVQELNDLDIPYPPRIAGSSASGDGPPEQQGALLHSALVLPLIARNRTLGALTLGLGPSGRVQDGADRDFAEDFAARAAVFLDNASLYQSIQEADRHKNEFLSMLAHELRNPLAPIRNAVEFLRMHGGHEPPMLWARDVIYRQVHHLVRMVDDLLDVSRITQGKIRLQLNPVDLAEVATQAVETSKPLIDARRHQLSITLPDAPLWVKGDATRLSQVASNLLNNAAKYTEEGGRIWLTVRREKEQAILSVRDSGIGIPSTMLPKIFELFTQVNYSLDRSQGGLGIGLTLVHRLVEMHGGQVEARSPGPNQGSEFTVRLPVDVGPPPVPHTNGSPATADRCGRILVVDDNVDAADSLAMLLQLAQYEVRTAHTGPAALEQAKEFSPQVVLLDIGLPGMTGYEVAKRLREGPQGLGLKMVAITGYGQEEDRRNSKEAGFDHHLTKPVDPDELLRLLQTARVTES